MFRLLNVSGRAALEVDGAWFDLARLSGDDALADPMAAVARHGELHDLTARCAARDARRLGGRHRARPPGAPALAGVRHRAQLPGPRRRGRHGAAAGPAHLHQVPELDHRPHRRHPPHRRPRSTGRSRSWPSSAGPAATSRWRRRGTCWPASPSARTCRTGGSSSPGRPRSSRWARASRGSPPSGPPSCRWTAWPTRPTSACGATCRGSGCRRAGPPTSSSRSRPWSPTSPRSVRSSPATSSSPARPTGSAWRGAASWREGDVVVSGAEGIGELRNACVAGTGALVAVSLHRLLGIHAAVPDPGGLAAFYAEMGLSGDAAAGFTGSDGGGCRHPRRGPVPPARVRLGRLSTTRPTWPASPDGWRPPERAAR